MGPYLLDNSNRSTLLAFPDCAHVAVRWSVVSGSSANFSVWPPPLKLISNCSGPPPTNSTCPSSGCDPYQGPPVCYEAGQGGSCSFTSTQEDYEFALYEPCSPQAVCPSLGNLVVSFTADYR